LKLGIFGGSFDPIHVGHIRPVQEARRQLALDRVVFLPTAVPPHKPDRQFAPPHARYAMVELALLREEGMEVSPLELTPGRPWYTVDTLRHFHLQDPQTELYLLIGGDGFAELDTWHEWQDIVDLCQLAVLTRPEWQLTEVHQQLPSEIAALASSERVHFIRNQTVDVSATEIRGLLASGAAPASDVIPGLVLEYIQKYSLYQ
jgi:nicotinate (nicotinamide) nucleotide adenylyltransferase